MENSLAVLQKIKLRVTIGPSNSTPRYIPKGIESRNSNKYLYMTVHSSFIHSSHKLETAQVSINR